MSDLLTRTDTLEELTGNLVADKADGTARKYRTQIRKFADWLHSEWEGPLSKRALGEYRRSLALQDLAPSTINGRLTAVRQLVSEAASMGLLDHAEAQHIASVQGVRQQGQRAGDWLTRAQAQRLLDAPDVSTLKGKRDKSILGLLLKCGLRRSEVATLTLAHLEERQGRPVILDLLGKGGRVRTIPLPGDVRRTIETWLEASEREPVADDPLFVSMRKGDRLTGRPLSTAAVYDLVQRYGEQIGKPDLAPHDLRRTWAKLARKAGALLEQVSLILGHENLETTQRYLGSTLDFEDAATDLVRLEA